jgi:cell division protein FtsL
MTPPPPAGGTATAGRLGRAGQVAPRIPRRTSGPARGRAGTALPPTRGPRQAPPVLQTLRRLPDARVVDGLLRGRAWIALIAVALLGIVFMQVSLLKLNSGISRAVTQADLLERQNSQLRAAVSGLDAEARIEETASLTGLHMPAAGDVRYLDARQADPARAARSITPPDRVRAATIRARTQGVTATATTGTATANPATAAAPSTTTSQPATTATTTSTTPASTAGAGTTAATTAPSSSASTSSTPASVAAPASASATPAPTAAPTATTATTGAAAAPEGGG